MRKDLCVLPDAIKKVIDSYDKDVLNNALLINIISDVVLLDEPKSVKNLLREILKNGYGKKILLINPKKESISLKIQSYSDELTNLYGYNKVLVLYVLYSIAYGVKLWNGYPNLVNSSNLSNSRLEIHNVQYKEQPIQHFFNFQDKRESYNMRNNDFCRAEYLKKTKESFLERIKRIPNYIIVSFIIVILLIICLIFLNSRRSSEEELFYNSIRHADSIMSNGNYSKAALLYKELYLKNYFFNSSSYKCEAIDKIGILIDDMIEKGMDDYSLLIQAQLLCKKELQIPWDKSNKIKIETHIDKLKNAIVEKIEIGINSLLINIHLHNGSLDEDGKRVLKEHLELSPDNYWLNFIKNKEK